MPKILVNIIQGFSARVRPEWTTVSHMVKHALEPHMAHIELNVENPGDRHCIRRSLSFLNRDPSHVVLIGKSLGGVRTWWMLRQYAAEIARHRSVHCIFIDPHGWQVGDGVIGSYGKNRGLPYYRDFDGFELVNFYQHNRWPCGAVFKGQDFNRELGPGADHFNITDMGSSESEVVRREISWVVERILQLKNAGSKDE